MGVIVSLFDWVDFLFIELLSMDVGKMKLSIFVNSVQNVGISFQVLLPYWLFFFGVAELRFLEQKKFLLVIVFLSRV